MRIVSIPIAKVISNDIKTESRYSLDTLYFNYYLYNASLLLRKVFNEIVRLAKRYSRLAYDKSPVRNIEESRTAFSKSTLFKIFSIDRYCGFLRKAGTLWLRVIQTLFTPKRTRPGSRLKSPETRFPNCLLPMPL